MKTKLWVCAAFAAALAVTTAIPPLVSADHLQAIGEARYSMGTVLEITLYHSDGREARMILDEAFSTAQRLDDLLSNYKPESEINRVNRRAGIGPVKISAELHDFLDLAKSLSGKTGGAFDITVDPLIKLWQEAAREGSLPSNASMIAARSLVGSTGLILHRDRGLEFHKPGMRIDTGGIGKGYAVDKIADVLQKRGIVHGLINFGHSSIRAIGPPPHASAWRLLLQFPGEEPLGILEIRDGALSVSSSMGGSFEIRGKRYGHLMDPRTGTPVSEKIQAVVLAPTATAAEALSKFVILRPEPERKDEDLWRDVKTVRMGEDGGNRQSEGFPLTSVSRLNPE